MEQKLEATFSVLVMSIASSAAFAMGLAPHPQTGETQKDKDMARFNIDLLNMLKTKAQAGLTDDERRLIESLTADLQMKFLQM